jgi:integrase
LVKVETRTENGLPGATEQTEKAREKIFQHAWWMKKQGYAESTIETRMKILKILVKRGANILDPESMKETIAKQDWSEGRKELAVDTYSNLLITLGGSWDPPRYRRVEKIPFIPTEKEIDQLIAGCGPKTTTFLQLLKETAMRRGEAWSLKWTDIDFVNGTVSVTPEKHSKPRMFRLSNKLLAMLTTIPRKSQRVFGDYHIKGFAHSFTRQRKRIAIKLGNPRIQQISLHTFRHWKATMEYHKTKDILHVMKLLGHKNIKNTLIYTQLVTFESDEYHCKTASSVQEATELIETGYEYVCDLDNVKLFRKRK